MDFSSEEIAEFKVEATDLLTEAEACLLNIEKGADFRSNYDAIFRAFHSVKGASGMLGWVELQTHMHTIENHFQSLKGEPGLGRNRCSYFLAAIDVALQMLDFKTVSFKYELPGVETKSSPLVMEPPVPSGAAKVIEDKPLVVIIDDEPDILEILTEMLQENGFAVKSYINPVQALSELKSLRPTTILTDMKMPEMSGEQVLSEVRKFDLDLPVIYVSGQLTKQMVIDAVAKGIFSIIEKPFKESQVISLVDNATKRYQTLGLLNRSIDFVLFQFSDLDEWMRQNGKEQQRRIMTAELNKILESRRLLRSIAKGQ